MLIYNQNRKEMKYEDPINNMTFSQFINKCDEWGFYDAARLAEKKTNNGQLARITVYDCDNAAYETGLSQLLQDHTTWFNCRNKSAFTAIFKHE